MAKNDAIYAEMEVKYITTDISLRKLAKEYGVALSRVNSQSKNSEWVRKRAEYRQKVIEETVDTIAEKEIDRLSNIGESAELLAQTIKDAVSDPQQFTRVEFIENGEIKECHKKNYNVNAMRQFAATLKDLASIIRDVYEIEGAPPEPIEVCIVGDAEKYSK